MNEDGTEITRKGYYVEQTNQHGKYQRYMKPKKCKISIDNEGYYAVVLNGKRERLHRLIYENLVGEIPEGYVIDHINGNKLDNSINNLRIVKQAVNARNVVLAKRLDIRKSGNKFFLRFSTDGDRKYYGMFDSFDSAKSKYDELYQEREQHYKNNGLLFER